MRTTALVIALSSAALALSAGTGRAQPYDIAVGGGIGVTASAQASGPAYHGSASFPLVSLWWPQDRGPFDERRRPRPRLTAALRGEAFYQGGTVRGSSFACERVTPIYCLGRTDENRIAGAAAFVRIAWPWSGRFRFYFDPIGAGVYSRRTSSSETQGPTTFCLIDGRLVGCPDNPPWATFEYRTSRVSIGANTGFGMLVQLGPVRTFAEFRAHRLFESGESIASAVPLTVGLVF